MPRRRRRRREGPAPSSTVVEIFEIRTQSLNSNATTILWEAVTDVENTSGETQNRKITSMRGTQELICRLAASHYVRVLAGFLVWPESRELPTIAEWDPFEPTQPGVDGYEGQPSFFGRRDLVHALPASASNTLLGQAEFMHLRPNRLLKPGYQMRFVAYARGQGTFSLALNLAVRVEG